MKKSLPVLFTILLISCGEKSTNQEIEEVVSEPQVTYASYGAEITSEDYKSAMSVAEIIGENDSLLVKLTGEIEKTCKMKGCWMTIKTGDSSTMRVTFKDYGFFVPKEGAEGKSAIFDGVLSKSVTSVETLRHYAQDEGKSAEEIEAITEPKEEFAFVANGVLIEDQE